MRPHLGMYFDVFLHEKPVTDLGCARYMKLKDNSELRIDERRSSFVCPLGNKTATFIVEMRKQRTKKRVIQLLTLLVLVPYPDKSVILCGRGKEGPIWGERKVRHGVRWARLPHAAPAEVLNASLLRRRVPDVKGSARGGGRGGIIIAPELNLLPGGDEAVTIVVPRQGCNSVGRLQSRCLHPPIIQSLDNRVPFI